MKYYYQILLALSIALFSLLGTVKASHVSGGDITYECVGPNTYLVTLKVFRDCAGIQYYPNQSINITDTCGGGYTSYLSLQSSFEVSQICAFDIGNTTCNGGAIRGQEQYVYSGIINLSNSCDSWIISWSTCCRDAQISNGFNNASIYIYSSLNTGVDSCNSSPLFSLPPLPNICLNEPADINLGIYDNDLDSLVYSLTTGMETSQIPNSYVAPYTFDSPLPDSNLTLDSLTGIIHVTPYAVGVFVVVLKVAEYDRTTGLLKGESIRDFQVVVSNCTNSAPEIGSVGITNYSGQGSRVDSTTIAVCGGDVFSFDLVFSDTDTLDTLSVIHNIHQTFDSNATISFTGINPITVSVSCTAPAISTQTIFSSFMVTDDACPVIGASRLSIKLEVTQATVASNDLTICDSSWTDLSVTGGTVFNWSVITGSVIDTNISSPLYNMSCVSCANPSVSPQVTTTYLVTSNNISICGNTDTVVVTVAPNFSLSVTPSHLICVTDSAQLWTSQSPATNQYTYQWSPSIGLSTPIISNPKAQPTANTTYAVKVKSFAGCEKSSVVTLTIDDLFPNNIQILSVPELCNGDSATLAVDLGNINVSCGLAISICKGSSDSVIVGTGASVNTNNSYPAPYGNLRKGARHQILFTAAELNALGFYGGQINSLSLNIGNVGTASFDNFEIKMGCTSSNDLSQDWETGLVTVLNGYTHFPVLGWNEHIFTAPYNWDGVSNLIVEMCHNNIVANSAGSSRSYYTITPFYSVRYLSGNSGNVCSSTVTSIPSSNRPNVKFNYCNLIDSNRLTYNWSPSTFMVNSQSKIPIIFPNSSTNYTVIVTDTLGVCADTISHYMDVVSSYDASFSSLSPYCLNDTTDRFIPLNTGGFFTGIGVDSLGNFSPDVAGVGIWSINYNTNTNNSCTSDSNINVEVLALPDATITEVEVCNTLDSIILRANTPGGIWSGIGIVDSVNGVFSTAGIYANDYTIIYNVTTSCSNADTATIRIIRPFNFIFVDNSKNVCEGQIIDLSSNYVLSSDPLQGSGPVKTRWSDVNGYIDTNGVFDATMISAGTYAVTLEVSGMDGTCGTSQTMQVEVREIEYPSFMNTSFCVNDSRAYIDVDPWFFGSGVSFTQTPLAPLGANDTLVISAFGQNGLFDPSLRGKGRWEMELTRVNSFGCVGESVDTIYVLEAPTGGVTRIGSGLSSNDGQGYSYHWLNCNNNNTPVFGATNQTFNPGIAGSFAVEVSVGNCSIVSNCYDTWPLGVQNVSANLGVSVYPNPTENVLNIDLGNNDYLDIEITDNTGKVVLTQTTQSKITTIDLSHLSAGVYVVKTKNNLGEQVKKIVKQ